MEAVSPNLVANYTFFAQLNPENLSKLPDAASQRSKIPSKVPSKAPSKAPSAVPSKAPSQAPSQAPSKAKKQQCDDSDSSDDPVEERKRFIALQKGELDD